MFYENARSSRSGWPGWPKAIRCTSGGVSPASTGPSTSPPIATSRAPGERSPDLVAGRGAGGHIAASMPSPRVLEIQEEITARIPTGPEAARLGIPEGTPVFEVIRTYHTADGPLDVAMFVIRADMAVFDYRFPVPD
jgi:hypothetical protein